MSSRKTPSNIFRSVLWKRSGMKKPISSQSPSPSTGHVIERDSSFHQSSNVSPVPESQVQEHLGQSLKYPNCSCASAAAILGLESKNDDVRSHAKSMDVPPSNAGSIENPLYVDIEPSLEFTHAPANSACRCPCLCTSDVPYYVTPDLQDCDGPVQTVFLQKVFFILFLKACIMLSWLLIVEFVEVFNEHYNAQFRHHFITGGIYVAIKITIRMTHNCRNRRYGRYHLFIVLFLLENAAACDFLGCTVCYWFDIHFSVPHRILACLGGTFLFFVVVGAFVTYDMKDGVMLGTALIVTGVISAHQFFHAKSSLGSQLVRLHTGDGVEEIVKSIAVLLVSEVIMAITMLTLRSVLSGFRYSLTPRDWFYTATYII